MNSGSDEIKLVNLNIIKGYLIMFGESFEEFLSSTSHLKTFFSALLQVTVIVLLFSVCFY